MNEIETTDRLDRAQVPRTLDGEFEELLGKAETLLEDKDVLSALRLLLELQRRYVDSVRLFELISQALLLQGKTEAAIRHKVLHGVLRGIYRAAIPDLNEGGARMPATSIRYQDPVRQTPQLRVDAQDKQPGVAVPHEASDSEATQSALEPISEPPTLIEEPTLSTLHKPSGSREDSLTEAADDDREVSLQTGLFPMTEAMAKEFMRQGHFHRAQEIFTALSHNRPEDRSLQGALESAVKKNREKQVLGVFQRWLKNIETMKTPPNS